MLQIVENTINKKHIEFHLTDYRLYDWVLLNGSGYMSTLYTFVLKCAIA